MRNASIISLLLLTLPAAAFNPEPLRLAIEDLTANFPQQYTRGPGFLERLSKVTTEEEFASLQREALLANPLLDFDRIMLIQRKLGDKARSAMSGELGVGTLNAHTNDSLRRLGWDNQIAVLSGLRGQPTLKTLHQPDGGKIIADLELHPDAGRIMFSSIGSQGNWRVFEMNLDGKPPRQITPDDGPDVGHFDSCYLPDDRVIFASTAVYQGLPCEAGGRQMVCLYQLDPKSGHIRQLTFEQDSDWCPTVLPDGRVMYLRWEYSDLAHSNSRILFQMNPDGTNQGELYGSNSYFPNSFFHARPMPGHPSKIIGVAGGHHGIARSGRLLIIDPTISRREAEGVVQEIPGRGKKVEAIVRDRLVDGVWPQFLMPYPLSEKYVLVSCKPSATSLWGIYLVDVFDNMTLIHESEDYALLEPRGHGENPARAAHPGSHRSHKIRGHRPAQRYLSGPRPGRHSPRHRQEPQDHRILLQQARQRRPHRQPRHGRTMGHQARPRHRPRGKGWFRPFQNPRANPGLCPTAR